MNIVCMILVDYNMDLVGHVSVYIEVQCAIFIKYFTYINMKLNITLAIKIIIDFVNYFIHLSFNIILISESIFMVDAIVLNISFSKRLNIGGSRIIERNEVTLLKFLLGSRIIII